MFKIEFSTSGVWHRVVRIWTNVLKERIISIFRVKSQKSKQPAC
jgi:hypothetical protein